MFKSLGILVGLDSNGTMYSYYPMPNESGIKIELINKNNIDFNNIKVEVSHETNQFESNPTTTTTTPTPGGNTTEPQKRGCKSVISSSIVGFIVVLGVIGLTSVRRKKH